MFDKIYVSPQVKRIVIITKKHGIHELSHDLPNDLRLRTLIPTAFSRKKDLGPHKKKRLRTLGN